MNHDSKLYRGRRVLVWCAVAIVALIGIVMVEVSKSVNIHDYSSNRNSVQWPERLTLVRSDLVHYLRHQFNVKANGDRGQEDDLAIQAGLCQVVGRSSVEPIDIVAADATLLVAQQPWFSEFVEIEKDKLSRLRTMNSLSMDDLRAQFVKDLAALEAFQSDFPRFIEDAAKDRGMDVRWLSGRPAGRTLAIR